MLLLAGCAPFFLMHFREAKLPVHVQMQSSVGGNSSPLIHTVALINLQEQYRTKATQKILRAQTGQKIQYDKNTTQSLSLKWGTRY